jgi:putative ABC transport system permease protein
MEAVVGQAVAEPRFNSLLLWVFATIALLLSAIGVYGVMSYAVAQRTREFAIRMAIGAESRSIFQMVTRDGLAVAIAGISIGLGGALLLGRTLASLLYGVVPNGRLESDWRCGSRAHRGVVGMLVSGVARYPS